jgi:hypothetical protein
MMLTLVVITTVVLIMVTVIACMRKPSRIPPIIHKVLIQNDNSLDLKALFSTCDATREAHESWRILNPNHEIRYYSGHDCRVFLKKHFKDSDIINTYDALVPNSYKCDFFRFCVLYIKGGYYSDWKQVLKLPLNDWIDPNVELVCAWDISTHMYTAFLAARPKLPMFHTAITMIVNNVKQNYYGNNSLEPTGPGLLIKAFEKHYTADYGHEVDNGRVLIGNHSPGFISFRRELKIVTKHPKLGQSQHWENGNNYNVLYGQNRIYATK